MTNVVVIIQARLTSKRLPRKILRKINGKTILEHCVDRASLAKNVHSVIVAIPDTKENQELEKFCAIKKIEFFKGPEYDVLQRYVLSAGKKKADVIVRLTSDCPLIDPKIIDQMVNFFFKKNVDYVSNTVPIDSSFWPDGSDVEVFSMEALLKSSTLMLSDAEREHVTFKFWQDELGLFSSAQLTRSEDLSAFRFTLDYEEDFMLIDFIFEEIKRTGVFGHVEEVTNILKSNEHLRSLNSIYTQGQGWNK